ncbi:AMP-binding protein [Streptomyces sp. BE133]|uniref:AMP-binding protein n=1 Tax=Streptomyces sp. BE133 TaxID=3002523 RepID=UPI002E767AE3|nr:AMP-binding protein [Streptomyces sp. BE133]MEE1806443.1 AMP-binding protein [Streptomyces sp. BE133]
MTGRTVRAANGSPRPRPGSVRRADGRSPLADRTIGALLRETVARRPEAVALRSVPDGGGTPRQWTYAELLAEAESVASGILARLPRGSRVAIWAPNVPEWPVFEYAAALAGVTLVTLNPAFRAADLTHALGVSEAEMLVHADRSRAYDMAAVVSSVAAGLPRLRHVVSLSDWDDLKGSGPLPAEHEPTSTAPAQIQFTSGTTGAPKAVLLSHQAVVNVPKLTFEALGVRPGATVVSPLPMFHTAGCVISCLGPLWSGGTFVLLERFDPKVLLSTLSEAPGAVLTSVPTVLSTLNEAARDVPDRPVLSSVLTGAAPVRPQLIAETERLFSTTVFNLYGQTELASVLTLTRPDDTVEDKAGTVGRPLPHAECKIVHPESGAVQPLGVQGEICARGYQQMISYYGDPAATAGKVDAEGWLHTGDLGSMDATGTLRIDGRLNDLIIRGGENIAPAAIEEVLAEVPGVREAVVVGVPDDVWGEEVAAVVQPVPGAALCLEALLAQCEGRLTPYKIPVHWFLAADLPLTASGKVQRFRVAELAVSGRLERLDSGTPTA